MAEIVFYGTLLAIGLFVAFCILSKDARRFIAFKAGSLKEKENPHQHLQKIIDEQTTNKHSAMNAVRASEEFLREIERVYATISEDAIVLQSRLDKALENGDDNKAKIALVRLNEINEKLVRRKDQLEKQLLVHKTKLQTVEKYDEKIRHFREMSKSLKIESDFAIANRVAADFELDLKTRLDNSGVDSTIEEIKNNINQDTNAASLSRKLATDPNQEYLDSIDDEDDIDAQLAEIKLRRNKGK